MIFLTAYILVGIWANGWGYPPLFGGRPEAPDYSGDPPEVIQARSHVAWHRANKIPRPCGLCGKYDEKAQAAQRAHAMGMRRTP